MKKLIAVCACVLCLTGCGSSQKSGKSGENTAGNFAQSVTQNAKPMKFSSEEEFDEHADHFWLCEGENNEGEFYKIRFFAGNAGFSWDFSCPPDETFEDYIKRLVKSSEEANGTTFRSGTTFLVKGTNIDGVEMLPFELERDPANGTVKANGEVYGTFLDNGKFKCGNDIYTSQKNLTKLSNAFRNAKISVFEEKYGEPATYKDVKADPYSYLSKYFTITGTAELDDYYNYDYRDFESIYFCVRVTPTGGGYADCWYIYCSRSRFNELHEALKDGGSRQMTIVCTSGFPDSLKNEMADLVDYCM